MSLIKKRKFEGIKIGVFLVCFVFVFGVITAVNAGDELIVNGGFESIGTGWQMSGTAIPFNGYHHTGIRYAVMGQLENVSDILSQTVTIPNNITSATLSFWYNITSEETAVYTKYDKLNITIRNTSNSVLATVDDYSNLDKKAGGTSQYYSPQIFNMTQYAGQTVKIYFWATTDDSKQTTFRIDDVSLIVKKSSPNAPSNVSATALSANNIAFIWQDNADNEIGFKIERKVSNGSYSFIQNSNSIYGTGQGGYFEDQNLQPNTNYCYRIRSYNLSGDSPYSNEACATTHSAPAVLPTVVTGNASNISYNSANLNGTIDPNGENAGGFFQWGATASYGNLTSTETVGNETSPIFISKSISNLQSNTVYHFRLVGVNSNSGSTVYGNDKIFTTLSQTTNKPGNFILSNENPVCDHEYYDAPAIRLNWTESNKANSYHVYRDGDLYENVATDLTFYNSANVAAEQTYQYYVQARNASGNTNSNSVSVYVRSDVCDTPPFLSFEIDFNQINYGNVKLNTQKIINGDSNFGSANSPTVRNNSHSNLNISIQQDDMGLGFYGGKWNAQYNVRVGNSGNWITYNPYETVELQLQALQTDSINFGILVNNFLPGDEYQGILTVNGIEINASLSRATQGGSDYICGNGIIEGDEECDNNNFGGQTCGSFGFDGGNLSCSGSCQIITSGCSNNSAPAAHTMNPSNITHQSATITGTVAPHNLPTEAFFLWRIQGGQSTNQTESQQIGSGYCNVGVNETLTGLSPNTTYEYQVWGVNSNNSASGDWLSFKTLTDPLNFPTSQCSDGIDNDGDGKIDYPDDPGCDSAEDDMEEELECTKGANYDGACFPVNLELSNYTAGMPSDHTLTFTSPITINPGTYWDINYLGNFDFESVTEEDVYIVVDGIYHTVSGECGDGAQHAFTINGDIETCDIAGATISQGSEVVMRVGQTIMRPAYGNQITNPPVAGEYSINMMVGGNFVGIPFSIVENEVSLKYNKDELLFINTESVFKLCDNPGCSIYVNESPEIENSQLVRVFDITNNGLFVNDDYWWYVDTGRYNGWIKESKLSTISEEDVKGLVLSNLEELKEDLLDKIDLELHNTSFQFRSSREIQLSKRWADLFGAPLFVFDSWLKYFELQNLFTEPGTIFSSAKGLLAGINLQSTLNAGKEVADDTAFFFSGPQFIDSIEGMLDYADNLSYGNILWGNFLEWNFKPDVYQNLIKNELFVPCLDRQSPVRIYRKATRPDRRSIEAVDGAAGFRRSLINSFSEINNIIANKSGFQDVSIVDLNTNIITMQRAILVSKASGVELKYEALLKDGDDYKATDMVLQIGALAEFNHFYNEIMTAFTNGLEVEIRSVKSIRRGALMSGLSACTKVSGVSKNIGNIQNSIALSQGTLDTAIGLADDITVNFSTDAEILIYEIPQSMVMTIPIEYSNIWMMVDDLNLYSKIKLNDFTSSIPNNEIPKITIIGDNPMTLKYGQTYEELGVIVSDDHDNNLEITVTIPTVIDSFKPGTYFVTYSVIDSGELSAEATRIIFVHEQSVAQCSDGFDNDEDNLIDEDDPDCHTDGYASNSDSYDKNIQNEIDPLILKYEPILYLHHDEIFQPMSVKPFVEHSSLWRTDWRCYGGGQYCSLSNTLVQNEVTLDDISTVTESLNLHLSFSDYDPALAEIKYGQLVDAGNGASTYYIYKMEDAYNDNGCVHKYIVLQYWYFYAMNNWKDHDGLNNHEGDWETVMIFLDKDTQSPEFVAYSSHHNDGNPSDNLIQSHSVTRNWDDIEKDEDESVISFVAVGAHANYPDNGAKNDGNHKVSGKLDLTSRTGEHVKHWERRVVIAETRPLWLYNYEGQWGYNVVNTLDELYKDSSSGPVGPYHSNVAGINRFAQPVEWAGIKDFVSKTIENPTNAVSFSNQSTLMYFEEPVQTGTKFSIDLHDEYISYGENLNELTMLPHFWDIGSSLKNDTFSVDVEFQYDVNEVRAFGMNESELSIFYYNPSINMWEYMPSVVNTANSTISFNTTHFSIYAIGQSARSLETQIAITKLEYGEKNNMKDILNAVIIDTGDGIAPLLLSELKESSVDLEDYTPDGKLDPGQKKKIKMKFKFLESAGNEYQGKSINVNFKFLAT